MTERPILLFDGVCNLCHSWVQFVLRHDRDGRILFAPLQSDRGRALLRSCGRPDDYLDGVVLIEGTRCSDRSTAALRLVRLLPAPWPVVSVLLWIPRPVRDLIYGWVASNRYRWFGKKDSCPLPSPEVRERFLT